MTKKEMVSFQTKPHNDIEKHPRQEFVLDHDKLLPFKNGPGYIFEKEGDQK